MSDVERPDVVLIRAWETDMWYSPFGAEPGPLRGTVDWEVAEGTACHAHEAVASVSWGGVAMARKAQVRRVALIVRDRVPLAYAGLKTYEGLRRSCASSIASVSRALTGTPPCARRQSARSPQYGHIPLERGRWSWVSGA